MKSWYPEARFGMFVHWGLYSMVGRGEWDRAVSQVPREDYAGLMKVFDPAAFDARSIVRTAADAGQKWITITSRHHDGFSMYDTGLSDFKITNSPFGRDPIAELAEACRECGIRLGFYVSLVDWHHPGYLDPAGWQDYLGFLHGQVEELCTQYGEVGQIWLDGDWPHSKAPERHPGWFTTDQPWDYERLYAMIHDLQPHAVVLNNRKSGLQPGEDVQGFENDLPGENSTGLNPAPIVPGVPLETCLTMNRSWGYVPHDDAWRDVGELLATLLRCVAADSNLLLNVGPTQSGTIPRPAIERLLAMGRWLAGHGEAVYGAGPSGEPGAVRTAAGQVLPIQRLLGTA
ncbi:alpha-L-fucosidase [Nonomuraea gerenzanensis]|uniref:alpha-L-fucosidase n=1 Tax=Nonomuraea gerenzanensis TaxID=93944 RepID=A0A1M4EBW1_9ACTN|nr:alpha-L-fucosidase [Nonomuraea gerenzanensis]UBU18360.1 alpha-L-fucosidase [Nonomuraea gerenzanensis]SBO96188.1 Alpha-L-fucosidase [Nonomuraea gerenzanensis]